MAKEYQVGDEAWVMERGKAVKVRIVKANAFVVEKVNDKDRLECTNYNEKELDETELDTYNRAMRYLEAEIFYQVNAQNKRYREINELNLKIQSLTQNETANQLQTA